MIRLPLSHMKPNCKNLLASPGVPPESIKASRCVWYPGGKDVVRVALWTLLVWTQIAARTALRAQTKVSALKMGGDKAV